MTNWKVSASVLALSVGMATTATGKLAPMQQTLPR